jgi:hypothetical protein
VILCGAAQPGRAAPPLPQPSWKQLNAEQRRILAPLAGEWDKMEGFRRKKWLGIAQRYQTLSPEEQARMQKRMTAWAKLTPEERKQARDKYLQLQKAPPEKKETVKQKWEAYKELPDAEKERLKAEAARKTPARPVPKPGPAAKPSPAAKPAPTPPATPAAPQTPAPAEPASDQAGGSGTR